MLETYSKSGQYMRQKLSSSVVFSNIQDKILVYLLMSIRILLQILSESCVMAIYWALKLLCQFFIHNYYHELCFCGWKFLAWHVEDTLLSMCVKFQKNIPNRRVKIGLIVLFFAYSCCMFNDKIPQQGTTDLRRNMHDSWVFPLLLEDNLLVHCQL